MNTKDKFYTLLRENDGFLSEFELGQMIGLNEEETQVLIAQLLSEYKIEYLNNRACNYSPVKKIKNRNKI